MHDNDCVTFLQSHLPRLGLRWAGYRKVRRTVCKRLRRRLRDLRLDSLQACAAYLTENPEEWRSFEINCRIPISRFYRDRGVFDMLADRILPDLAHEATVCGDGRVACWSAGCASGEEPYSLRIAWAQRAERDNPTARIDVLGTDADATMLRRAKQACYQKSSLKDLPQCILEHAFAPRNEGYCLRPGFKACVRFARQDLRSEWPDGSFDLILCRNLAFTYFEAAVQAQVFAHLDDRLRPGGYLVIGSHERLPITPKAYEPWQRTLPIYRKRTDCTQGSRPETIMARK
jgi:chemotaxis protein methyltransferase CheR